MSTRVVALMMLAVATTWAQEVPVSDGKETAVVVLPFTNISGAPADDWLSVGIAESIRVDVSAASGFISLSSTDVEQVQSAWVVSGAFQRVSDRLRITVQLTDADGRTIRAATLDGAFSELFALQAQIIVELGMADLSATNLSETPIGALADPEGFASGGFSLTSPAIDPPAPIPPAVESRNSTGQATVRANRLNAPIVMDGLLTEAVYTEVPAITGFIQQEPMEGQPATERTEAWILFDDENIYISARCWQSRMDQVVANEMRRDEIFRNDNFAIVFDTFHDQRTGVLFRTSPIGALMDMEFTEEPTFNLDWNTVWDVRTAYFDGGWTVEFVIPFRSLRYPAGVGRSWGVNLGRTVLSKNERSFLTLIPASLSSRGFTTAAYAGNLVGLEVPDESINIDVKPYAISGLTSDFSTLSPVENQLSGDAGVDIKYKITQSLTADFTVNTDFAQVEVDEQQVNLTRFSLFFPEKREFFLEGRGIFQFARGGVGGRRPGGSGGVFGGVNAPTLFYSRRIGLQRGRVVPILGGGRVTGKIGQFDVGALSIQTDDEVVASAESTNFTVLRLKRDILRRSTVGGIFTNRSVSTRGHGSSRTYGVDSTFAFYDNLSMLGYLAKTETPGLTDKDSSYQGKFDYAADRYGFQVDHLVVEDNFVPDVGFVRRDNFRRTFIEGRFSPRPQSIELVRQFSLTGSTDYIPVSYTHLTLPTKA